MIENKALIGLIFVVLVAVAAGCVGQTSSPTPAARSSTSTVPVTMPPATTTPGPTAVDATRRLVARRVAASPAIDGQVDPVWSTAEAQRIPLAWGFAGTEHALDMELRALYTDKAVCFLARWPGDPPPDEENTVYNELTMHWRIPDTQRVDCTVACHTAFANGRGSFVYVNAETIPQGSDEALPAAGGWRAGTWTLEWSRPLVNDNPIDLQFTDLSQPYLFFVKVFGRVEGHPDPVSEQCRLEFQP